MRVVAFLQNCWFPADTPAYYTRRYLTDAHFRRHVLANSMSGKRLKKAFGKFYDEIWWDNASMNVGTFPGASFGADPAHMRDVLIQVNPNGILCFGKVAADGMDSLQIAGDWQHHIFPHPNARGLMQSQIDEFAEKIIGLYF